MKFNPMIRSLLETDLYKFSQNQLCWHQFPEYRTKWEFRCRNKDVVFTLEMIDEIREQIDAYCGLRFTEDELDYLKSIKWLKPAYIDFLRLWHPRREDIFVDWTDYGCNLDIWTEGSWLNTSPMEIPILAIVNETYFRMKYADKYVELQDDISERYDEKMWYISKHPIGAFSEFGLRRRFSGEAQDWVVKQLAESRCRIGGSMFIGTSNVYLARKYADKGIIPVGTMAHESLQCVGQGDPSKNPAYSNRFMMEAWVREFGVDNGIMLTDCLSTDLFLLDFDRTYATLFSGVRHDSGDPFEWGEKILAHYKKLGIDPQTKTLLFSDSLDFVKAAAIYDRFRNECKVAFGIGTYLANDAGVEPLNIVMKVTQCNGRSVAKISDEPQKSICTDSAYIDYLKRTMGWRFNHQ